MGLLVEGKWVDQWYDTKRTAGQFVRQASTFRDHIGSQRFPAEKNRYHLYVSHACPWAHRTVIFRRIKQLEDSIGMTVVDAHMGASGWQLSEDPVNGRRFMHEIYTLADPNYTGRVTVPVLWDTQEQTIVNNESYEIIRMFNSAFNTITDNQDDYYPESLRTEIDTMNQYIYTHINNGVYKVGFATQQDVYDAEVQALFDALDEIEERLSHSRYLVGNHITEADWRLFTTLVRFDWVYVGHFKCNIRRMVDYPNLSGYLRDLYQQPLIKETVHSDHIKTHYYTSHTMINPTAIVPKGPEVNFDAPHQRDQWEGA